jgi:polyferredoxin
MLAHVIPLCLALLVLAVLLTVARLIRGPSVADRILALDTLSVEAIALIVLFGMLARQRPVFRGGAADRGDGLRQHRGAVQVPPARRHHRMNSLIEALVAFLLLAGSLFALLGAIGLYRLPDFYTRLHAPTKASTLGVGGVVLGSLLYFSTLAAG